MAWGLAMGLLAAAGVASACTQQSQRERPPLLGAAASVQPESARAGEARSAAWEQAVAERREERARMVDTQLEARGVSQGRVLEAMLRVPRHRFVLENQKRFAYEDRPLPIVGGQTISQPFIVGFMSEAADVAPGERCLEIGTGSGYQAAVLAELCGETYSIEYLPDVAAFGRQNLDALGYLERAVRLRVGDGYVGWPESAPFDAILVTAAPARVPAPLLEQLALKGRLVIPVGGEQGQTLEVWTRIAPGNTPESFTRTTPFDVRFVPFLGPGGK